MVAFFISEYQNANSNSDKCNKWEQLSVCLVVTKGVS